MQFVLPTCRGVAFGRYALGFAENRRPNAAPLRQRPTDPKSVRIRKFVLGGVLRVPPKTNFIAYPKTENPILGGRGA